MKNVGDEYLGSIKFVLGSFDLVYFGEKHIVLLLFASILIFIVVMILIGTWIYISKMKKEGRFD